MTTDIGRVPDGTGLSSTTEPQSSQGLGPSGFDPSRVRVITKRDILREAPNKFAKQYNYMAGKTLPWSNFAYDGIAAKLLALDTETCTASEIDALIGNTSWTVLECDLCGRDVERLAHVGEEPDYEARWQELCLPCLEGAARVLRDSDGSPKGGDACGSVEDDSAGPEDIAQPSSPESSNA